MRISKSMLQHKVDYINRITGNSERAWYTTSEGERLAKLGHYQLSQSMAGYNLEQIVTEGGGVTNPISLGSMSGRELYRALDGFIAGLEANK